MPAVGTMGEWQRILQGRLTKKTPFYTGSMWLTEIQNLSKINYLTSPFNWHLRFLMHPTAD